LTFQPKFSTKISEESDPNRFDSLYQDAIKRKQSHPSPDDSFSFSPKLSARVSSGSTRRDPSPLPVGERLYKLGTMNNKPASIPSLPLDPEATFTPQISKRANSVDRNRSISTSDRLHMQSKEQQIRLEKLRESMNAQMTKECSFTPRLSHSAHASTDNTSTVSARDVTQRLLSYEVSRQAKIEQAKKQLEEQTAKNMTFRPQIPVSSRFATPTRQGQNIFEKLSKQTLQKDQNLSVASLSNLNHSFSAKVNII